MGVVVMLTGIVEERGVLAIGALDDFLQGLALEFGALQQIVAGGHVGVVMLVVVEFQRFLRHMRRKGVIGIGKVGEREGHGVMSEKSGRRWLTETFIEGSNVLNSRIRREVRLSQIQIRLEMKRL